MSTHEQRAASRSRWSRKALYGRSRAKRWPLWVSWLLAPSKASRRVVRDLMVIRRGGGDV